MFDLFGRQRIRQLERDLAFAREVSLERLEIYQEDRALLAKADSFLDEKNKLMIDMQAEIIRLHAIVAQQNTDKIFTELSLMDIKNLENLIKTYNS